MKVRLLTLMAGPTGVVEPGQEIEVDGEMAHALIAGGFAVTLGGRPSAPAPTLAPETTTLAPAERAVMPPGRPRRP